MKKFCVVFFSLVGLVILATSCNDTKTYAQYLKEERNAIKDLLRDSNFVVLNEFPKNGVFAANEFYLDEASGVYFNVISRGDVTLDSNGDLDESSKVQTNEKVYVRYKGLSYFSVDSDTTKYNNMDAGNNVFADSFTYYGVATTANLSSYYSETSAGWTIPLDYVGHNARVKMIIPFNFGWSYDRSSSRYVPALYDLVIFRLEKHIK